MFFSDQIKGTDISRSELIKKWKVKLYIDLLPSTTAALSLKCEKNDFQERSAHNQQPSTQMGPLFLLFFCGSYGENLIRQQRCASSLFLVIKKNIHKYKNTLQPPQIRCVSLGLEGGPRCGVRQGGITKCSFSFRADVKLLHCHFFKIGFKGTFAIDDHLSVWTKFPLGWPIYLNSRALTTGGWMKECVLKSQFIKLRS